MQRSRMSVLPWLFRLFEISDIDIFPQDKCCFLLTIIQYLILRPIHVKNHLFLVLKRLTLMRLNHKSLKLNSLYIKYCIIECYSFTYVFQCLKVLDYSRCIFESWLVFQLPHSNKNVKMSRFRQ